VEVRTAFVSLFSSEFWVFQVSHVHLLSSPLQREFTKGFFSLGFFR
jgi:hypothetical protein